MVKSSFYGEDTTVTTYAVNQVALNAPHKHCWTTADGAEELDFIMLMYDLLKYS